MNDEITECPLADQSLGAADWSLHIESCAACQSLISVAGAIRAEAGEACRQADPPSAQWILLQAELRRRQEVANRAAWPLRWMARVGVLACMIASFAAVYSAAPEIAGALRSSESVQSPQPLGLLIPTTMVPLILLMTCVLRTLWADD